MSYRETLIAAGMDVIDFNQFGSWSGKWAALVRETDGSIGLVSDWFGSCTMCDAFESEFYDPDYDDTPGDYQARLKEFGERYTSTPVAAWLIRTGKEYHEDGYLDDETYSMYTWISARMRGELA